MFPWCTCLFCIVWLGNVQRFITRAEHLYGSLSPLFCDVFAAVVVVPLWSIKGHDVDLSYWQTRTHCCGHIVADTNVSPFARARNICYGHKFCVRDTKMFLIFVQKHLVSATNVSQFARARKHHEQQCVHNNVSSFASTFSSVLFASIFVI